jgi:hypothetical protein
MLVQESKEARFASIDATSRKQKENVEENLVNPRNKNLAFASELTLREQTETFALSPVGRIAAKFKTRDLISRVSSERPPL